MSALKNLVHRFFPVWISLIFLVSTLPRVVRAASLEAGQWNGAQEPVVVSSNALISFYLPIVRRSGTTACGEITRDTTWTIAANPCRVTCDVIVPVGVTLSIEEGVTVQFEHLDDDLIISGTLQTRGSENDPIRFQPSRNTTPGSWGRVAYMLGSSGVLDHAILEYGGSSKGMVYIASDAVQVVDSVVQYSDNTGIYIHDASPLISATQIVNNIGDSGGGLYNDSGSPIIINNNISDNKTSRGWLRPVSPGGGFYNLSGNPSVLNNTFNDNGANGGGGLYNDSGNPIIQNNVFTYNHSLFSGGGLVNASGSPIIQNNIFNGNQTHTLLDFETYGGGLYTWGESPIIQNNVFVGNVADNGYGGGLYNDSPNAVIRNNIIANNFALNGSEISGSNTPFLDYNDVYNDVWTDSYWDISYGGVTPGLNDISADPMLVDPANGDYHLAPNSPCIDAGNPFNYPATDFEGDPRPMGWAPDIGADEYEYRTLGVAKSSIPYEASPGAAVKYTVTLVNFSSVNLTDVLLTDALPVETAFKGYHADGMTCTHHGSTWGGKLRCTLGNASLAQGESRALTVSVVLASTFTAPQSVVNLVTAVASAGEETITTSDQAWTRVRWCRVKLNGTSMGSDIQAAINASTQPSDVVKVSGECRVHDLSLDKTLILQGGWNRDFSKWNPLVYTTTLDAQGQGRVIEAVGMVNPIIEGFFITGGKADGGGGIYIPSGSPTIQNNTFASNSAGSGGGLENVYGNPIIQNNLFMSNSAFFGGGGLYNDTGNPIIQNNTFTNNSAFHTGGGLHNYYGNPTIQDNTFSSNSAYDGGGLYNSTGNPFIQNNTFSNNSAEGIGGGLYNDTGNPTIQNNTVFNNNGSGIGNISGSPIIRSNIVVSNNSIGNDFGGGIFSFSPLILDYNDVWNNSGGDYNGDVTSGTYDISADPRLVDPANGDFHLAPGSPCIDAGDPVNYPPTDFEGDPRPRGPAPDIGADEWK